MISIKTVALAIRQSQVSFISNSFVLQWLFKGRLYSALKHTTMELAQHAHRAAPDESKVKIAEVGSFTVHREDSVLRVIRKLAVSGVHRVNVAAPNITWHLITL